MKRMLVVENNKEGHKIMEIIPIFDNGSSTYIRSMQADPLTALFSQHTKIKKFKKKQAIYQEGNHPLQLFLIKKGIVKTFKCNGERKELITGIYGEGDYLGYVALLENTMYKDVAVALEHTELAMVPKDAFEELMETDWQIARKFITLLAKDIADKNSCCWI